MHCHVVFGDDFLSPQDLGRGTQIDAHQAINVGNDQIEAGTPCADQPPKAEDHPALVLLHNLDGWTKDQGSQDDNRPRDGDQADQACHLPTLLPQKLNLGTLATAGHCWRRSWFEKPAETLSVRRRPSGDKPRLRTANPISSAVVRPSHAQRRLVGAGLPMGCKAE